MLSPLVRRRKGFRTPYPVKNAGVGRNTDPAARTSPPGCTAWKARRFGSPRTPWQAHRRACTIRRCRGGGCSARRSEPPAPRTVPQSGTESIPQGSWTRRNPPVKRLRPYVRRSLLVAPVHQPKIVDDIATAENEDPLVAKWGQASAHLHPLFRCKRHVETDLDNRDKRQEGYIWCRTDQAPWSRPRSTVLRTSVCLDVTPASVSEYQEWNWKPRSMEQRTPP